MASCDWFVNKSLKREKKGQLTNQRYCFHIYCVLNYHWAVAVYKGEGALGCQFLWLPIGTGSPVVHMSHLPLMPYPSNHGGSRVPKAFIATFIILIIMWMLVRKDWIWIWMCKDWVGMRIWVSGGSGSDNVRAGDQMMMVNGRGLMMQQLCGGVRQSARVGDEERCTGRPYSTSTILRARHGYRYYNSGRPMDVQMVIFFLHERYCPARRS